MVSVLTESVHIERYDSLWPDMFVRERHRVAQVTQAPLDDIQHIGSTAVPGLAAKPIVDIMLGVPRYPPDPKLLQAIATLGYESMGEAGVMGRWYLRKRTRTAFNLHIVERGGAHWIANWQFRDYLRSNADARERYVTAKHAAISAGAADLLSYSEHKAKIIGELLGEAAGLNNQP